MNADLMNSIAPDPSESHTTADQLELSRIASELKAIEKRHDSLRVSVRTLMQREGQLASELDLALQFNARAVRPASAIAIEIAEVRLGIGELERLRREAERKKAELEARQMNLSFALSSSDRHPQAKSGCSSPRPSQAASTTPPVA